MSPAGRLVGRGTHRPHNDRGARGGRGSRPDSKKAAKTHFTVEAISPSLRFRGNTFCPPENSNPCGFTAFAGKGRDARGTKRGSGAHADLDRGNQEPQPERLQVAPSIPGVIECVRMVLPSRVPPDPA